MSVGVHLGSNNCIQLNLIRTHNSVNFSSFARPLDRRSDVILETTHMTGRHAAKSARVIGENSGGRK